MLTKTMTIKSMDDAGKGLALIATLSAVDHDGDTYQPGAFSWKQGGHQWVSLLPAHDRRAMPFGKARVYEDGDHAYAELNLNLETEAGREWHAALKFDLATGDAVVEWSYGYDIIDMDYQIRGTDRIRVLKRLDVDEVSPVLRGAGVGTGTLAIKSAALRDGRFKSLIDELGSMAEAVDGDPNVVSATGLKQLRDIHEAIGRVFSGPADDDQAKAAIATDTALGEHLKSLSRRHIPVG